MAEWVALFGGLALVGAFQTYQRARVRTARLKLFRTVAEPYREASVESFRAWQPQRLNVVRRGARIRVTVTDGQHGATEWRAVFPRRFPDFSIRPEQLSGKIAKSLLDAQDLEVGHRSFDARFIVEAKNLSLVRSAWGPKQCEMMVSSFPRARISSRGSVVSLCKPGVTRTVAGIRDGIELIGELAASDLFGEKALRALPDAQVELHPLPRATVPGMVNVVIEPYDDGSNTVTRATCLAGPGHERPPAGELARIGATFTRSKSVMQLTWAEIEKDPRHLQRGVELLRDLTRPPETGAFR